MSDIQRGITFTTSIPDAASAHQLVDNAVILPAFITTKATAPPSSADSFIFSKNGALRRCTLDTLINAFPRGAAANVFSLRKLGTQATMAAAGNDPRFPAQFTGLRKANNHGPDTAAVPKDTAFPSKSLDGAHTIVDWDQADVFHDDLATPKTYTFTNVRDGRTIQFIIKLNGRAVTLPAAIGTVVIGTGTTFLHLILTKSVLGITGLQIKI